MPFEYYDRRDLEVLVLYTSCYLLQYHYEFLSKYLVVL